jgi:UPF0042 nucleotide-binding protein
MPSMPSKKSNSDVQEDRPRTAAPELVIISGLSGSGKGTVLKAFEDLGFYAVDNLPIALVPKFADLTHDSKNARQAALIIDVREGDSLKNFPTMFRRLRRTVNALLLFLDASDDVLQRRFSETRRPHPFGAESPVMRSLKEEREMLAPLQNLADITIDTSRLNVHELRNLVSRQFRESKEQGKLVIQLNSFGFRHGVPNDSDLVFDVRFLPNPNYIPQFKKLSGRHPSVARYIRSFPQTTEFINRISDLLIYLIPHYIREGKSYLTISFGCTGGHHRSVMIAAEIRKRLSKAGFTVKETHRDIGKP